MDNKKLILEKIRSDNSFGEFTAEELEKQLDSELAKSAPDFDLVDELTSAILEARGKAVKEIDVQTEIQTIRRRGMKRVGCPKWAVAVAAACVMLIGANAFTISAWGMNIISAIVQISKGGMSIDLNHNRDIIELPVSEGDPYGIKAKCAEYGINPLTPYYLPEGFELTDFNEDTNVVSSDLRFYYSKGKEKLIIGYTKYFDSELIPPIGIPTDSYNLTETELNGHLMYILKEDNQFTATFLYDNIVYIITSNGLDYDECQRIIESLM